MKKIDVIALKFDGDEMRVLEHRLKLHAAHLQGLLSASEGETIQQPRLSSNETIENIDALTAHINALEHRIGAGCPQFKFDAGASAAASVPRPGLTADNHGGGSPVAAKASANKKETLTEKIVRLKGATSLDQLAARHSLKPADMDN